MVDSWAFIKRMRYEISRVFHIDYKGLMTKNYPFLTDEIPGIGTLGGVKSYSLFFFLNFLYIRKHRNSLETQSALHKLKKNVEEESNKSANILSVISLDSLLQKAFELSNDGLFICGFRFEKSELVDELMKYIQDDHERKRIFEIVSNIF